MTDILIRPIKETEYGIFERFLYESLHIPPGYEPFPWDTIYMPEIYVYIKDFGKKDDVCFVAETDGLTVGAAYSRILSGPEIKGFGNIDDETPELAISILPDYRGKGIGRELLDTLNNELSKRGYTRISLSVQKTNPALNLYKRVGYEIIKEQETDYLMIKNLR